VARVDGREERQFSGAEHRCRSAPAEYRSIAAIRQNWQLTGPHFSVNTDWRLRGERSNVIV
jgi:hypothetical protein